MGEIWRCKRRALHCLARRHVKDGGVLKRSPLGQNHTPQESRGSKNRPASLAHDLPPVLNCELSLFFLCVEIVSAESCDCVRGDDVLRELLWNENERES